MCQVTLDASDITAVTEKHKSNIEHVKETMFGLTPLYASEVIKQLIVIAEQGPGAIAPALTHAFLTGLQLGQKLPSAYYPGRQFYVDDGSYDEEEETELTFQLVRNS